MHHTSRLLFLTSFLLSAIFFSLSASEKVLEIDRNQTRLFPNQQNKNNTLTKLSTSLEKIYHDFLRNQIQINSGNPVTVSSKVVVTIFPENGQTTQQINLAHLQELGIQIQAMARYSLRAEVDVAQLARLASEVAGISYIRYPLKPKPCVVTSEAVTLTNADRWHSGDYAGNGVKIAVIDGGFMGLTDAQAAGELPSGCTTQDISGYGLETGTSHGTAVAEAIYDLAPGAELYLYKIVDLTDLQLAVQACIDDDVEIINHSMAWFNAGGYYDGTGYVATTVQEAIDAGILWVNSAGNESEHHYRAVFNPDSDGNHLFASGMIINPIGPDSAHAWYHYPGDQIIVTLNWDDYPRSDEDYDLYLIRWTSSTTWVVADSSVRKQNGWTSPEETIYYTNQETLAPYGVIVKKYSASDNADFTLFSLSRSLGFYRNSASIADPGSVSDVITVGAIDRDEYTTGPQEYYSSQGPTTDGRIKPDIMGADGCESYTSGVWYGTSLASPHVAGGIALLKSRYPDYSNTEIKNFLFENAVLDLGETGKDNIYGNGVFILPLTGLQKKLAVSPASWDFAQVVIGDSVDKIFRLKNEDSLDVEISNIACEATDNDDFSIMSYPAPPYNLKPGDSLDVTVRFYPLVEGEKTAKLKVTNNSDNAGPILEVPLQGECVNKIVFFTDLVAATARMQQLYFPETLQDYDVPLPTGSEVGIYDDSLLVGAYKIVNGRSDTAIVYLADSSQSAPGAGDGNAIQFRLWNKNTDLEYIAEISQVVEGAAIFQEGQAVTVKLRAVGSPLPVELVGFSVIRQENGISVEWQTKSESNNYGFEIQRSRDSKIFEQIGFVKGAGTSSTPRFYSFRDRKELTGTFYYRLKQIDFNGAAEYSDIQKLEIFPNEFRLVQNFPNPFNSQTKISFILSKTSAVRIEIFDTIGRKIRILLDAEQPQGTHSVVWDGKNFSGIQVSSGVYFYRIKTPFLESVKKMILIQ